MVRGLRQVLDAVGDERRRHVPDVRPVARGAEAADAGDRARTSTSRSSRPATTDDEDDAKAPWHFKLLMVLLALYLTWRIVDLFL